MYGTSHRDAVTLVRATCALALACATSVAHAAVLFDADAGFLYDSNLNRAYERADVRADTALTLDASAGSFWALSGADGLTLFAHGRTELYHRFHGLNWLGAGASASYRHKFGVGSSAPWIAISVDGAYD